MIGQAILRKLFPRKFAPKITRVEILSAVPVRNSLVEWETNDQDEVVLKIPRREDRTGRLLQRAFVAPPFKQVVLDELGSDVWLLCTGSNSVDTIVKSLAKKYKLGRREVELSLSNYLRTLAQRGYIGLAKPVVPGGAVSKAQAGMESDPSTRIMEVAVSGAGLHSAAAGTVASHERGARRKGTPSRKGRSRATEA